MSIEDGHLQCNCCGDVKKGNNFYSSNSPLHKKTKKFPTCKPCIWDFVSMKKDDIEHIKNTLRMLDKPFLDDYWQSSVEEANRDGKDIFGTYMKNVVAPQNKHKNWSDSEFNESAIVDGVGVTGRKYTVKELKGLKYRWGKYESEDYEYLENFYFEYENTYPTDTPVQINLYRNIAKIHLQAEKELSNANIKQYKDLMEISSKLHNDANIKPIQSSGMNDDKGLSTYGLWIKTIEQDEPCEYFENKSIYEDADGFKKYIDKWFVRPFKNIFNISKDFNVKDD